MLKEALRSTITRVNVKKRPATGQYNGAAFFARKYCGGDSLAKLADSTIQFNLMDKVASYENIHGFYKDDAGNSAYVIGNSHFILKLKINKS